MKNEVKKKMHPEWRAMVYQSHRETTLKKKIVSVVPSTHVMNTRSREIKTQPDLFRPYQTSAGRRPDRNAALAQKLTVFDRFRGWRIYNEVAKSSREHDQWRLSMMLSSFPVVVLQ
jgi:hypothetical protein